MALFLYAFLFKYSINYKILSNASLLAISTVLFYTYYKDFGVEAYNLKKFLYVSVLIYGKSYNLKIFTKKTIVHRVIFPKMCPGAESGHIYAN